MYWPTVFLADSLYENTIIPDKAESSKGSDTLGSPGILRSIYLKLICTFVWSRSLAFSIASMILGVPAEELEEYYDVIDVSSLKFSKLLKSSLFVVAGGEDTS